MHLKRHGRLMRKDRNFENVELTGQIEGERNIDGNAPLS